MVDLELVDDERLIFTLLVRDAPEGYTIAAELDIDTIDGLPFASFAVTGGEQGGNGPGLWTVYLTVNAFNEGQDATWDMCRVLYRIVHGWGELGTGALPGVGYVSSVRDVSKFTRTAAAVLEGKQITQYTGSFALTIRS